MLKLFTMILFIRLSNWVESKKIIPEWQAGFRESRDTLDHIFTLNALMNANLRNKGGKLYTLAVDLKSAFPSVPHNLLWIKLNKIGISHKIINIIRDLYNKASMTVKTKDVMTDNCSITRCVLQGETLSPLLYSLYISDLGKYLTDEGIRGVQLDDKTATFSIC